jgi:RNA recognition motif-containing protein
MRINAATPKRSGQENAGFGMPPISSSPLSALSETNDPTNTTVFIGGLDPNVSEDELRSYVLSLSSLSVYLSPE